MTLQPFIAHFSKLAFSPLTGAAIGGGLGALYGGLSDPGPEGSRVNRALGYGAAGAGMGGLGSRLALTMFRPRGPVSPVSPAAPKAPSTPVFQPGEIDQSYDVLRSRYGSPTGSQPGQLAAHGMGPENVRGMLSDPTEMAGLQARPARLEAVKRYIAEMDAAKVAPTAVPDPLADLAARARAEADAKAKALQEDPLYKRLFQPPTEPPKIAAFIGTLASKPLSRDTWGGSATIRRSDDRRVDKWHRVGGAEPAHTTSSPVVG